MIAEIYRFNEYLETNYRMSYFHSKDGLEIDLILQKGQEKILIEIKSKSKTLSEDLKERVNSILKVINSCNFYKV